MPPCAKSITHRHLRFVVAASEAASFRKAAARLNVKESTISRRVRELELAIGLVIFVRLQTGVRLTPSGASFILLAQEALQAFDKALSRSVAREDDGNRLRPIILEGRWIATPLPME